MSVNIRPYIIINGKSSNEITGLMITSLPPITKPQMRVSAEEIDGRDGDIVTELGYSAYDKPIEIALVGNYDVDEVISYFNQSGIISFSNEPDKYYKFAQYAGIDYEKLVRFKTAKVNFHVQPYKYSTESNDAVFYSPSNVTVTNAGNTNSRPSLAIQGSGDVEIAVNGSQALQIELGDAKQAIIIDSDEMNAYGTKSNIKELITDINPVQDLHGYDSVWAGGAGKNKLNYEAWKNAGIVNGTGVWENNGVTLTATANDCYTSAPNGFPVDARVPISEGETITLSWEETTNRDGSVYVFPNGTTTGMVRVYNQLQKSLTYTATAGITFVVFRFGVSNSGDTISYKNIQIEKGSTATDWTPYENICDISGWNGCDITRTGKNLVDDTSFIYGLPNTAIGSDITSISFNTRYAYFGFASPKTECILSSITDDRTKFNVILVFGYKNGILKSYTYYFVTTTLMTQTIDFSEFDYCRICIGANSGVTTYDDLTGHGFVQIEIGSSASSYEKYVGSKYQQFFEGLMAGTYGVVELGSLTWQKNGVNRFTSTNQPDDIKAPASQTAIANVICPIYQTSNFSTAYGENVDDVIAINTNKAINIVNKEYSDASDFKNAMSGVYLIYELETATAPSITQEDISNLVADFNADLVCVVFGQEVFGAHLNVTTGLLTIDKVYLNNIANYYRDFNTGTYSTCYRITLPTLSTNIPYSQKHGAISNCAKEETGYYGANRTNEPITATGIFAINPVGEIMAIYDPDTSLTKATFESKYANFEAVFPLAQPVEIQLTAQDLMTLIGKNNIMSNTGAISELIYTHAGADVTAHGDIVSFDVDASDLKDNILKNRLVTGNYDNLMLKAGANQLGITGNVDVIVLSNFSRWL